jgi:hypothetical protein
VESLATSAGEAHTLDVWSAWNVFFLTLVATVGAVLVTVGLTRSDFGLCDFALVVCLGVGAILADEYWHYQRLGPNPIPITATITRRSGCFNSEGGGRECNIDFEYVVDGVVYDHGPYSPGPDAPTIKLFYNPKNPDLYAFERQSNSGGVFAFIIGVSYIAAVVSVEEKIRARILPWLAARQRRANAPRPFTPLPADYTGPF